MGFEVEQEFGRFVYESDPWPHHENTVGIADALAQLEFQQEWGFPEELEYIALYIRPERVLEYLLAGRIVWDLEEKVS